MTPFSLTDGIIHAEDIALSLIAERIGTPVYAYSEARLRANARAFVAGLSGVPRAQVAFAVKANPNLGVLSVLADEGLGADVVSGGEIARAIAAGIPADRILFSGVGKTAAELVLAIETGIGQVNIEHEPEGRMLSALAAARGTRCPAVLRVNPVVAAPTHAKIATARADSKFGVPVDDAVGVYDRLAAEPGIDLRGIAMHIGSQIGDLAPLAEAVRTGGRLLAALRRRGHTITHVDLGGGLGIPYRSDETWPTPADYGAMIAREARGWDVALWFEPGRAIAGDAGVLLTRVLWVKPGDPHPFVVLDAGMNDLARPALYDAYHHCRAVRPTGGTMTAHLVGPVCESGDTFARARTMDAVAAGDLVVLDTAGAYGATMASTYNSRPLVPEVLVSGDRLAVVADRIDPATILAAERVPPWLTRPVPRPGSPSAVSPG